MKITIETNKADEFVLDSTSADKDTNATIQKMDRDELFKALKGEVEFRMRLTRESESTKDQVVKELVNKFKAAIVASLKLKDNGARQAEIDKARDADLALCDMGYTPMTTHGLNVVAVPYDKIVWAD